jgi:hypothetical protein
MGSIPYSVPDPAVFPDSDIKIGQFLTGKIPRSKLRGIFNHSRFSSIYTLKAWCPPPE